MIRSTPTGRLVRPGFFVLLLAGCAADAPPPAALPKLHIDPSRVAVAGFSSGAAMAQQVHLAFSDKLSGAALLAGPPYHCAEGVIDTALGRCMKAQPDAPDAAALATAVRERAGTQLASLAGLAGDRVLVARGQRDAVVAEAVVRAQADLYLQLDPTLTVDYDGAGDFAHVFPTEAQGGACDTAASPYLGRCGVDFAGRAMQALFGAAAAPAQAAGTLHAIDQRPFAATDHDPSLADSGRLYVPPQCAAGASCGLAIVFHGCEQNLDAVGEAFVRDAGFNRWADALGVAVLYPQTRSSYLPLNPKACWDWWGYTGADYDTRSGAQLQWVANAAAALGAPLR